MQEKNLEIYLKELKKKRKTLLSSFIINLFSLQSSLEVKEVLLEDQVDWSDMDDEDVVDYFLPFYENGKLKHFYLTDALITFQLCGYEIKKLKCSRRSLYAKLAYADERIYLFTIPEFFIFKVSLVNEKNENDENNDEEIEAKIGVDGFSTIAFYKSTFSKKLRILELPEINYIFFHYMKEYIERHNPLFARLYSEDYNRYIF